ncbi:MAG: penicillin-binding protein 1C [Marinobacter sp.]|uniref:penicillin-binding protein 1C n=1 Tax=Marinobacter sp. TaxID=50741 RepID=UPI00396DC759
MAGGESKPAIWRWPFRSWRRLAATLLAIALLAAGSLLILDALFPLPLKDGEASFARVVTDRHGVPLRAFADANGVWRYPVSLDEVSPHYIEALIHYEDRWYYRHFGVNPLSLIRAVAQRLRHGEWISGGSTLTMQVARILEPHSRTFPGKLRQILRALQLEWHLNKDDILELYLNYAPFGGPLEGVQAASFTYFGKSADRLSRAESALLAVLPQAPSLFRPDRHPQRARAARDKVLQRLAEFGVWTESDIAEARQEAVLAQYNSRPLLAPLLARRLIRDFPHKRVLHSTVDMNLQLSIEQVLADYVQPFPDKTSAAVLVLDNRDMSVLAYGGSADFADHSRFGHVDMIQATRSPGSTLKPFLYGMALDAGLIHEQSLLLDVPSAFGDYRPANFEEDFHGPVSAREALQRSLNVPAVQVLDGLSPEKFYARLASAGVKLRLPQYAQPNLSLILGGTGTDLETLTTSFAALGRQGLIRPARYLMDQGLELDRRLLSPEAAWIIGNTLSEAPLHRYDRARSVARRSSGIAFKTGTSYGYRDAWVLATSEALSIGVWVGRPDGTSLRDNYGRHTAVPLLRRILPLFSNRQLTMPAKPADVGRNTICWPLGTLKKLQDPRWCMQEKQAWLIRDQAPAGALRDPLMPFWNGGLVRAALDENNRRLPGACDGAVEREERYALWPVSLEPWLPQPWRRTQLLPPAAPHCADKLELETLTIVGIDDNSELHPPPGQAALPPILVSVRDEKDPVHWFLDENWVAKEVSLTLADLEPGTHRLSAMNNAGQTARVTFRVGQ